MRRSDSLQRVRGIHTLATARSRRKLTDLKPGVSMRVIAVLTAAVVLAGCAKSDTPPAADTTVPVATDAAPLSVASVAGRWNIRVMHETIDTTLTSYVLTATADSTAWTFAFPDGIAIPMRVVTAAGDSIVTQAGPFPSQLRKGTQVTTDGTFRMQGDKIVGITTAHYVTAGADSVVRLRVEGTRAQ